MRFLLPKHPFRVGGKREFPFERGGRRQKHGTRVPRVCLAAEGQASLGARGARAVVVPGGLYRGDAPGAVRVEGVHGRV